MSQLRFPRSGPHAELRYVRAPKPVEFPEEEPMPESRSHLVLRTFLFRLLRFALGPAHRVGSDQFLYWNAADARVNLAPDVLVRLNVPDASIKTWKTWEDGGVPDLAVEIVSDSDRRTWGEKLSAYQEIGIKEVVRFDPAAPAGERLRVWDRIAEDLVEREIGGDGTPCVTLGLSWVVVPVEDEPVGLRLADGEGRVLDVPEEAAEARARREAQRAEDEALKRRAAEARVHELEEQLRRAQSRAAPTSGARKPMKKRPAATSPRAKK